MSAPLLVIDGDSLAHRAYHALPKDDPPRRGPVPRNALVGFANFLLRLWEAEQPRAVLTCWDTLFVPTYRTEALPGYQGGREFDDAIVEQLDLLPELARSFGFAAAKGEGYEADDFLAAGARSEEARGGSAVVATSDRDSFQLVSDHVTILQPVRGVSELRRVGPAEVREQYGIEPAQVPDFIALRGDPSDKIPGARGVGAKTAASILGQYGSLEAALEAGRFAVEAEDLRTFRRIATLDASAPLPELPDQTPTWAEASAKADEVGPRQPCRRPPGPGSAIELVTHPEPRRGCTRRDRTPSRRAGWRCLLLAQLGPSARRPSRPRTRTCSAATRASTSS